MCRAILENVLSGTKAGFKATRNLVFNQKAERSTMNRQKSRGLVENVLSGMKAGFKSILNIFKHPKRESRMFNQKSSSTLSTTLLALILGASVFMAGQVWAAKYVTDPTIGKVVVAPEYGGTLTNTLKYDVSNVGADAWFHVNALWYFTSGVLEKLSIADWAIDRDMWPFIDRGMAPVSALRGALAESWEQPDPLTYVFQIRQGVHWHDKAPMNGRELTAQDVEHTFHRMLGNKLTGTQFSEAEPSPAAAVLVALPWESVTATDKYTVVMKLKELRLVALNYILDYAGMVIQPPEVIEEYGDMKDWRNVVGTGPFELTDSVPGTSITWTKNPNYWGYDEKYPENRLPYIDELKALVITETATIMAGLRTAKIDFIGGQGSTYLTSLDEAESLRRTNPELVIIPWAERSNTSVLLNVSKPPFDDIRVRHAMQMALDLETMNDTYYKGYADWIPQGYVGRELAAAGYTVPFEEWSEVLKGYYTYDVAGAEKLLDEAGYPRGPDGIRFKTLFNHFVNYDLSFTELQAAYWREIGVDVDIVVEEPAGYDGREMSGDYGMSSTVGGKKGPPLGVSGKFWSGYARNVVRDAQYDAWYEAGQEATTTEELKGLIKDMDMRVIEQHWQLWGPAGPSFFVHQPWVIGLNGEASMGSRQTHVTFSRLWIDSELKEAMGY